MEVLAVKCPECGSGRAYKDGMRYTGEGPIQRFLCRSCGYRFSEPNVKLNVTGQFLKGSHPRQNHADRAVTRRDPTGKEAFNGFSFIGSEDVASHEVTTVGKGLNALRICNSEYRVCASEKAKNLETRPQKERLAGSTQQTADIKGKLVQYAFYMQKQGYSEATIKLNMTALKVLTVRNADLLNPESVG